MDSYVFQDVVVDIPASKMELQEHIVDMLNGNDKCTISFINPEIMIEIRKDIELKEYFTKTNLNIVDGNGLLIAISRSIQGVKYSYEDRYTGTEFFSYLPEEDRKYKVFLFGGEELNNIEACENVKKRYKCIDLVGRLNGYVKWEDERIVNYINSFSPDIIIVCLGCPKQERWINKNRHILGAKLVFGNGGSVDFWSGKKKRAGNFFIRHRIEWLYRLTQDLSIRRLKRQLRLLPFAMKIILNKWEIEPYERK